MFICAFNKKTSQNIMTIKRLELCKYDLDYQDAGVYISLKGEEKILSLGNKIEV